MAQPYVGEIRMFAGNFAPAGWMFCEGQLLPISENETLFQLIGTTYGGGGFVLAETGGAEEITLTVGQIPAHKHVPVANSSEGNEPSPINNIWAAQNVVNQYTSVNPVVPTGFPSTAPTGGSQPHTNFQPYLCVNFIISLYGIFPSPT
jgi:microcystin-dependent protein